MIANALITLGIIGASVNVFDLLLSEDQKRRIALKFLTIWNHLDAMKANTSLRFPEKGTLLNQLLDILVMASLYSLFGMVNYVFAGSYGFGETNKRLVFIVTSVFMWASFQFLRSAFPDTRYRRDLVGNLIGLLGLVLMTIAFEVPIWIDLTLWPPPEFMEGGLFSLLTLFSISLALS